MDEGSIWRTITSKQFGQSICKTFDETNALLFFSPVNYAILDSNPSITLIPMFLNVSLIAYAPFFADDMRKNFGCIPNGETQTRFGVFQFVFG